MPKKHWTPEERKARGESLVAARLAKKAERDAAAAASLAAEEQKQTFPQIENRPTSQPDARAAEELNEKLVTKLEELEQRLAGYEAKQKANQADRVVERVKDVSLSETGELAGVFTKYPLGKSFYPDPVPQLQEEPFLSRFAFKENYILKWNVDGMVYETKWGTTVAEPKFTLALHQKMYDDDGKLIPGKTIRWTGLTIFEDPSSVRQLMVELELDSEGLSEKEIFDIVRYHRIKEWLKGFFQPGANLADQNRSTETVIDGRVVVIEEESSLV